MYRFLINAKLISCFLQTLFGEYGAGLLDDAIVPTWRTLTALHPRAGLHTLVAIRLAFSKLLAVLFTGEDGYFDAPVLLAPFGGLV